MLLLDVPSVSLPESSSDSQVGSESAGGPSSSDSLPMRLLSGCSCSFLRGLAPFLRRRFLNFPFHFLATLPPGRGGGSRAPSSALITDGKKDSQFSSRSLRTPAALRAMLVGAGDGRCASFEEADRAVWAEAFSFSSAGLPAVEKGGDAAVGGAATRGRTPPGSAAETVCSLISTSSAELSSTSVLTVNSPAPRSPSGGHALSSQDAGGLGGTEVTTLVRRISRVSLLLHWNVLGLLSLAVYFSGLVVAL